MERGVAVVYAILDDAGEVAAYYTLSSNVIRIDQLPPTLARRLPNHRNMPATLLGRMAVDLKHQEQGVATLMVADALDRAFRLNPTGSIALVVDAIDDDAVRFYKGREFFSLPDSERTLFIIRKSLERFLR